MTDGPDYFEATLSDFVHEMASAGAIRHLVSKGYSIEQIMDTLDYPTSRTRVEKTVYQYMKESGLLLSDLPVQEADMNLLILHNPSLKEFSAFLRERLQSNGEENSYMSCPFGKLLQKDSGKAETLRMLHFCLTGREQEYIMGIPWDQPVMYHRLNDRMLEIGKQLAVHSKLSIQFYFLSTMERLQIQL